MERNFRSTSQIWNFFWRDKEGSGMPDPYGELYKDEARPTLKVNCVGAGHARPLREPCKDEAYPTHKVNCVGVGHARPS
ncbi:hypothetical protein ERHA55_09700 [Erwinia rhapontici]|nr:hypothetical protein ERHA55_09700 [Erwinia rhapontici]